MVDRPTSQDGPFGFPRPDTPWALARLPVGRHGLPREFVAENQRNRLMAAALEVFAGRGYAAASIADVIRAAGVSRNTFYAHFDDKEACLLATYDVVVAWLEERGVGGAGFAAGGWGRRAVAVIGSVLGLLADDPRLARLCTVEILAAGTPAARRHAATTGRLTTALRAGRHAGPSATEQPPLLDSVLVGGAISVIARRVGAGEGERLASLDTQLDEVLLAPYLGLAAVRELVAAGP